MSNNNVKHNSKTHTHDSLYPALIPKDLGLGMLSWT